MSGRYVLVIDIGTSAVRCLLFNEKGHPKAVCRRELSYQSNPDAGLMGREFIPDRLWHMVCDVTGTALNNAGVKVGEIAAVSATSQREGMVFLDSAGKELYAGPNIDLRAVTEGISIDHKYAREIHSITGHLPSLMFAPAKLTWFKNNRPELYKSISTVLTISDWVLYKLCGEVTSEVCSATEIGLIDIRERTWSTKLVELLDLPRGIYPTLASAGSPIGKVTGQASDDTGIIEGTPVVEGAPDTHCGLLGMGICEKAETGVVTGWSVPVQMVTSEPVLDTEAKIWTGCYVFPGQWVLESNTGEAGNAFRWLKETVFDHNGMSSETSYDMIDKEVLEAPPGAQGTIASIGPGIMDMAHLGMDFGGVLFPLPLSVSGIRRGHLARAVLENICFAVKANLLQVESIADLKASTIFVGGNMTNSLSFRRILPDILDRNIHFSDTYEVSALGNAMLAAAGSGIYTGINEAMAEMKSDMTVNEPDLLAAAEYTEYYQQWLNIVQKLQELRGVVN